MRQAKFTIITLLLVLLSSIALLPAHAATLTVTDCTSQGDLANTITAAASGDTINFICGTVTIPFTAQIVIDKDLTINGAGVITFDGGNTTHFFTVNGGITLTVDGITFQNGNATFGGAIFNNTGGTLTITNSTFSGNSASFGGAIFNNTSGTLTISTSTFSGNSATLDGGAIFNNTSGTLTISTSTFSGNSASFGGAILNGNGGTLTISTSTFSGNSATLGGGIVNFDGTLTISNSTFSGNSSTNVGGAIYNDGTLTISNSTFSGNSSTDVGGAIYNDGTLTISNSTISGNSALTGGAIYNDDTATSTATHYENNTCSSNPITDNGGNTRVNSAGCPGSAPVNLDVAPLMCVDDNLLVLINAGDGNFNITGSGANLPLMDVPFGSYTILGMGPWSDVTITELLGDRESLNIGGITCPSGVIIPPSEPVAPIVTVLGCALDTTDGVEVANAPDNTYCRVLMTNGGVVNYSGAVPANLIGLGVILAVDVYRLEGGATINTFPNYTQICLAGSGRLFYMDARNAPYMSIELASESIGGATCGWIPAPGTLILTN